MRIDLSGIWQATDVLGEQARAGRPGYVAAGWKAAPVPGYFSEVDNLAGTPGRLLFRRAFRLDAPPAPGTAARLVLEGVAGEARVWCNGNLAGEQRGSYIPRSYDVARHLVGGENVVMVEVTGPGATAGLVREVALELLPGPAPERLLLQATPHGLHGGQAASAAVDFDLAFTAAGASGLEWTATVAPATFAGDPVTLAGSGRVHRGWNRVHGRLAFNDPRLWWTWDQGQADLYRFTLELRTAGGAAERVERLFGVRTVELRDWTCFLNGRRLFVRGTAYGPADLRQAVVTADRLSEDLDRVREANLNALWVQGLIAQAALYEEASRRGMLIWQEVPADLTGAEDAATLADRLGAWPAVALWQLPAAAAQESGQRLAGRIASLWNRPRQAAALAEGLKDVDPTRTCLSGVAESGRFRADEGVRKLPEKAKFVSEVGPPAFPSLAHSRRFVSGEWPDLNWEHLGAERLQRELPVSLAQSLAQYVAASQAYQAFEVRHIIEHFRRRKYRPCGGLMLARFADGEPAISTALLDYWREPKAAFAAAASALRPVNIFAQWPQSGYAPGTPVVLDVTLVNDRPDRYRGDWSWAVVRDGQALAGGIYPAELEPDGIVNREAAIDWTVPDGVRPGGVELVLTLALKDLAEPVVTRYLFDILPSS
ncbi:MAG TPA: hypothetical protein VGK74_26940 [Symbiobacteriaceae bacterium]